MKKNTLRKSMIRLVVCSWFIPLSLLTLTMIMLTNRYIKTKTTKTIDITMEKAVQICNLQLEMCISESKDISYDSNIGAVYESYLKTKNANRFYMDVKQIMNGKYKFNSDFLMSGIYFLEEPNLFYTTGLDHKIESQAYFESTSKEDILNLAKTIDTKTVFYSHGDHLYMVRNIVNHDFEPYAIIVMDLDWESIFSPLNSVWQCDGWALKQGNTQLVQCGDCNQMKLLSSMNVGCKHKVKFLDDGLVTMTKRVGDTNLMYIAHYDNQVLKNEVNFLKMLFIMMCLLMIPLIYGIFRFLQKRIIVPIQALQTASGEIASGNYNVRVPIKSEMDEIRDLQDNFNQMGEKLQYQFEKLYGEEMALKDAKLHALQLQINPHFLNNTLEIINWEARLKGNEKLANMIESLCTMMEATLDRNKEPLIPLKEELSYVKAYIYIIEYRFGDRFSYHEEIDANLDYMVPRLIIQPLIENAVDFAGDEDGLSKVRLVITGGYDMEDLKIEIINNGELSIDDEKRIRELLSDQQVNDKKSTHIGISNVNRRLKMIYNKESGLTINRDGKGNTVTTIIIKK